MKIKALLLTVLIAPIFIACSTPTPDTGTNPNTSTTPAPSPTVAVQEPNNNNQGSNENVDAITTASIVDTEENFKKAISKDGTWIIATLKDLTFDTELVLEGDFQNGRNETQRKIALYTQDDNRNITNRFTLTAPKLTIKSPNANISYGTFVGDIYVETNDFKLIDTKVEGNMYFNTNEAKTGFTMDDKSSITGKQELVK